jgi:phage shock protein A
MDTNSTATKRLLTENSELKKKIYALKASIHPIEAENEMTRESVSKLSKQVAQLTLLVEKLKLPPAAGGAGESSSSSGGRGGDASVEGEKS